MAKGDAPTSLSIQGTGVPDRRRARLIFDLARAKASGPVVQTPISQICENPNRSQVSSSVSGTSANDRRWPHARERSWSQHLVLIS
jgi:hypothetical protein